MADDYRDVPCAERCEISSCTDPCDRLADHPGLHICRGHWHNRRRPL